MKVTEEEGYRTEWKETSVTAAANRIVVISPFRVQTGNSQKHLRPENAFRMN